MPPNDGNPVIPASLLKSSAGGALTVSDRDPNDVAALESEDDLSGLNRVIAEIEGEDAGSKVIIWRKNTNNPRLPLVWLDELAPSQFSIKWLAETYGGGLYNVRVFVPQQNPDGTRSHKVKCAANKLIAIDGAPKAKQFDAPAPAAPAAPQTDLAAILTALEKSQQRMMDTIVQAVARPQPDILEQLEKFERIKNVLGGNQARPSGSEQFRDMMEMMRDMEEMRTARESGDNGMLAILMKKFFDKFEQLGAAPAPAPALETAHPAALTAPIATPAAQPSASGNVLEDEAMFESQMREFYIRQLIAKAKAKVNPLELAPEVLQMVDVRLISFLQSDTWFDEIVKVNKDALLYRAFFQSLRDEILRLIAADPGNSASGDA